MVRKENIQRPNTYRQLLQNMSGEKKSHLPNPVVSKSKYTRGPSRDSGEQIGGTRGAGISVISADVTSSAKSTPRLYVRPSRVSWQKVRPERSSFSSRRRLLVLISLACSAFLDLDLSMRSANFTVFSPGDRPSCSFVYEIPNK